MPIKKEEPNYAFLIAEKIEEIQSLPESMTFGEIMYTILRFVKPGEKMISKQELRLIPNQEIYTALCKAYQKEIETD